MYIFRWNSLQLVLLKMTIITYQFHKQTAVIFFFSNFLLSTYAKISEVLFIQMITGMSYNKEINPWRKLKFCSLSGDHQTRWLTRANFIYENILINLIHPRNAENITKRQQWNRQFKHIWEFEQCNCSRGWGLCKTSKQKWRYKHVTYWMHVFSYSSIKHW